jgi:hypothetical protein
MGREKVRKLRRRQRRRVKLKKLKARLAVSKDPKERELIIQKIRRISFSPPQDLPKA